LKKKLFSSSISIVVSLSLVLFIIGLVSLLLINTVRISNYVKENIGFTIMIKEGVKQIDIMQLQDELQTYNFVQESYFTSKEKATEDLKENLGEDFVDFLGYSPLLSSIDIRLVPEYVNTDSLKMIKGLLVENNSVHEVYYQSNIVEKLNNNIKKLSVLLLGFSILLFIISITLINNTIRLSVYSKRFLIRTMHLVGATHIFIQKPFLEKSIYQGIYSAIIAMFMMLGVLGLLKSGFQDYISTETGSFLNKNDFISIGIVFIIIFVVGILVNWLSTFLAVRKYIRIEEKNLYT
tara:strand:- start:3113 stop:3991 length:879 start_codon:yes stop_codon:yes gene_type:complete